MERIRLPRLGLRGPAAVFQEGRGLPVRRPRSRGRGGPIAVRQLGGDAISDAFVDACVQAGYPRVADYNADLPEGAAPLQMSSRNGLRCSAVDGYLAPATRRANLTVITDAVASGIVFEGKHARGVRFVAGSAPKARRCEARSAARRRRDPLAAAARALRNRRCRAAAGARGPRRRARSRSRKEPSGPSDAAHHVRGESSDHRQRHARAMR